MVLGGADEVGLEDALVGEQVIGPPEEEVVRIGEDGVRNATDGLVDASKAFHS